MRIGRFLPLLLAGLGSGQDVYFETGNSRRPIVPWSSTRAASPVDGADRHTAFHWAAFTAVLDEAAQAALSARGVKVLGLAGRPGSFHLYKVQVADPRGAGESLRDIPTFVNLLPILPEEKVTSQVRQGRFQRGRLPGGKVKATVLFHRFHGLLEAEALLKGKVDEFIPGDDPLFFHVVASTERVLALTELDPVARVEDYLEKLPTNDLSRTQTRVSSLQAPFLDTVSFPPTPAWNSGRPHTGDSIWICVNEGVDINHLDFRENTAAGPVFRAALPGEQWFSSFHGTHVAGIAAGNGWNSEFNGGRRYQWRGVAPKSQLVSTGEIGDANNHSFIFSDQGFYEYSDALTDERLSNHSGERLDVDNISLWAAANNGGYSPQYGVQRGYFSMLINAKNPIKVGSTEPGSAIRSGFSSMGPTRDGRIGPDVMAPGGFVLSTLEASQGYVYVGGTSMACPQVTGIAALLLQKYRETVLKPRGNGANIHDHTLWNSTVKAILVHTARDMVDLEGAGFSDPDFEASGFPNRSPLFGPGPDFATGYGLVDAERAVRFVDTNHFREGSVAHLQTLSYTVTVPPGRSNLRVTLAWDDPPFLGANDPTGAYNRKLVNDLDVQLVSPAGPVHSPWILDYDQLHQGTIPADGLDPITPSDILNNPARKGRDFRNNLEVVDVANPAPGTWRIEVRGSDIPVDQSRASGVNQDFSLVSDLVLPAAPALNGPDLVISRLTWTPSRPAVGQAITLRATLGNRGNGAAPEGVVHSVAYTNGFSIVDSNLTRTHSLAPGQIAVLASTTPHFVFSGLNIVQAWADHLGLINESQERNNRLSAFIEIPSLPPPWVAQDIGMPNPPGSSNISGDRGFFLIAGGRDIWGTADEFHFLHRPLLGNGEIRAHVSSLFGPDPWTKAGVMIRESTAPGSKHAFMLLSFGSGAAFQRRVATGGNSEHTGAAGAAPSWVRLVRSGNTFTGYQSPDGITWTQVGSAVISMTTQARIGLAVTAHQDGGFANADFREVTLMGGATVRISGRVAHQATDENLAGVVLNLSGSAAKTALSDASGQYVMTDLPSGGTFTVSASRSSFTFSPPSVTFASLELDGVADFFGTEALPAPWVTADVGAVGVSGSVSYASGTFALEGSGADIWGTADAFRFVHRPLTGDGEIRARVTAVENTDPFAKAGVMIRDGLSANARNVFMGLTFSQGATLQQRAAAGGTSTSQRITGFAAPYWVRLVRVGNVFTGYRSANGVTWTQHGNPVTLALPATVRIGLAVTSHNNSVLCSGTFDNVSVP